VPYLPIDPKDLGRNYDAVIRVNSQSGKAGMAYVLEQHAGVVLTREQQVDFGRVVQSVLDQAGTELSASALLQIFQHTQSPQAIAAKGLVDAAPSNPLAISAAQTALHYDAAA
jgi:isopropylmalate/homocitrate/citramalate synthase